MGTETITQSTAPWGPQQPYLTRGFQRAENNFLAGGPQYYGGQQVAPFGADTTAALGQYRDQAMAGNPITAPAQNMLAGTLQGDYLTPESNPYLAAMSDAANRQTTRQYQEAVAPGIQSQFANSGRTGSGLYANAMDSSRDTLGRNLAESNAALYGNNFQNERNRQLQAAQLAPQTAQLSYLDPSQLLNVGELYDAKAQQNIQADMQKYQFNQERPYDNLARYMATIGGGGYGSAQSQDLYTPPGWSTGLGVGLAGIGALSEIGKAGGLGGLLGGLF